jgi:hypothetical protein
MIRNPFRKDTTVPSSPPVQQQSAWQQLPSGPPPEYDDKAARCPGMRRSWLSHRAPATITSSDGRVRFDEWQPLSQLVPLTRTRCTQPDSGGDWPVPPQSPRPSPRAPIRRPSKQPNYGDRVEFRR